MARKQKPPADPTVTFWGAARTVTGSMHQVDALGQSLLLDCGLFQGRRAESRRRNEEFPFRPKDIDAVVLSHAHIDHCGNLPNLVKQGFAGPIYCTPATRALAGVMLGDAAKIQEEDAAYLNRHREKGEPKVEPLYDGRDVYRTLLQLRPAPYDTPTEVGRGLEATFVDAGHLLGSAMVHLQIEGADGGRSLTFTGDLGRPGLPILRDPAPVPPADLLLSESTYGGHTHEPVEETAERLGEVVRKTADRGNVLLIPAFAVGRTQTIIYFLHQLMNAGRLPELPIFVDSPLAARATEVFRSHPECFNDEARRLLKEHPDLFGEKTIRYVETVDESVALNDRPGPFVVIAASGMCEAGRILHHLKHHSVDEILWQRTGPFLRPDLLRRLADVTSSRGNTMSDFVRLQGKLPGQKDKKEKEKETGSFFLNRVLIKAVYPYWAARDAKTGRYYGCSRTLQGAELIFCVVVDMADEEYRLAPSEWDKVLTRDQIEQMKGKDEDEIPLGFRSGGKDRK
jgi:metallo-beta-lactamase family protein